MYAWAGMVETVFVLLCCCWLFCATTTFDFFGGTLEDELILVMLDCEFFGFSAGRGVFR
jgi:hypothetical protein